MPYRLKKSRKSTFLVLTLALVACIIISNSAVQLVQSSSNDFAPWLGELSNGGNKLGTASPLNVSSPCGICTSGQAWNGYLAYGAFQFNSSNIWQVLRSYLVIMTTNGDPVLYREANDQSYFAVKYVSQDEILFQGEPGSLSHLWNLRTNQTIDMPFWGHHDIEYNPLNNTFLTLQYYVRNVNGTDVLFDKIVEFDVNGSLLWSWDTYDHIPVSDACPYNDTFPVNGENVMDLTHSNTIDWDYKDNICYLNVRNVNTFYKINMTTGNIIWGCGEFGNFTLLDGPNGQKVVKPTVNGTTISTLWYHSHSVKEVEPDVFIMFDNDYHNQTNPNDDQSRMMEVTLNETSMTAWVSWSWTAPVEYWTTWGGDADILPNGDILGTFGCQTHYVQNSTGAVLVEVNPKSGQVVRTYTFSYGIGIYRVEYIPLETLSDYDGAWHTTDFNINLASANDLAGLSDIYYKINGGPTQSVNIDGQPHITQQGANNTLEYWSVDSTGLEELPHKTLSGIKLDETPPDLQITSPSSGSELKTSDITVTWTGSDEISGISEYEVSLDNGSWTSSGTNTNIAFDGLSNGNHTVGVMALDAAGNYRSVSVSFTINNSVLVQPTPSPSVKQTAGPIVQSNWVYEVTAVVLAIVAIVVVVTYTARTRKHRRT